MHARAKVFYNFNHAAYEMRLFSRFLFFSIILFAFAFVFPITGAVVTDTVCLSDIGSGTYRWKDVAPNTYSTGYQGSYSYSNDGISVCITYEVAGSTFRGTLTASGLKPNFAYQLKLEGDPSLPGSEGDEANENLKTIGRTSGDIGYLVFDYFITDGSGDAYLDFEQDSSYHVLWTTDQRTPLSVDGPIKSTTFTPDPGHLAYSSADGYSGSYDEVTVDIYGEREGTHPVGGTFLPDGHYKCRIVITEESFHDTGIGGWWAGAMLAYVEFDIFHNYIPEIPFGTIMVLVSMFSALVVMSIRKK